MPLLCRAAGLRHCTDRQALFFRIHLNVNHIVPAVREAQPNFILGLRLIANIAGFQELFEIEIKNADETSRILWAFPPRQAQPQRTLTQRNLAIMIPIALIVSCPITTDVRRPFVWNSSDKMTPAGGEEKIQRS